MSPQAQAEVNARAAHTLIAGLVACGAAHAVLSPGSRNTPLALACEALSRGGGLALHVLVDERAAGFYALGLARATRRPVLLACTSGSAGAHYLPAVIEAEALGLPLLVLTADRPPELHGFGANQTTRQDRLFGAHVRLDLHPGPPSGEAALPWLAALAARAVDAAAGPDPGPVHLNLAYREPSWPHAPVDLATLPAPPALLRPPASTSGLSRALAPLRGVARGLIVVGPRSPGPDDAALAALLDEVCAESGWVWVADAASGLRFGPGGGLVAADALARDPAFRAAHAPEQLVQLGGAPTSKPLFTWLDGLPRGRRLHITPRPRWVDPGARADAVLVADERAACEALREALAGGPGPGDWARAWREAEARAEAARVRALARAPLFGGSVARALVEALPPGAALHVASSMAVRDLDAFSGRRRAPLAVTSNRGVNGIDGTLATAFGQAAAGEGPQVVLLGDLAALHDLGALALLATGWPRPLVLVVVDNGGGGIFGHLPIASHPSAFTPLFLTPPRVDLVAALGGAGARARRVCDRAGLEAALAEALARPGVSALVCAVDGPAEVELRSRAWEAHLDHA